MLQQGFVAANTEYTTASRAITRWEAEFKILKKVDAKTFEEPK